MNEHEACLQCPVDNERETNSDWLLLQFALQMHMITNKFWFINPCLLYCRKPARSEASATAEERRTASSLRKGLFNGLCIEPQAANM